MASNPYLNRIRVVQGDIAAQEVDAVVTLLPQNLEYRGDLNSSLREAAGAELDQYVAENVYRPRAGDVYVLPGFNLPVKHIICAISPVWKTDFDREDRHLLNVVRKSMEQAKALSIKTLAFPPIGSGGRGFPKARAARLILQGISDRLDKSFDEVRIVCRTPKTKQIFADRLDIMRFKFE